MGEHWIETVVPLQVHMDTLLTAWFAMIVVILLAFVVTRKLDIVPDGLQSFSESIMEFLEGMVKGEMGEKGLKHAPLISSLFLPLIYPKTLIKSLF